MPCLLAVTAVMQAIGSTAGAAGPWWIWVPAYMMLGWSITVWATYAASLICPNLRIGGWMFFGLFVCLEPVAFLMVFTKSEAAENIIRFGNDLAILLGLFYGTMSQIESRKTN